MKKLALVLAIMLSVAAVGCGTNTGSSSTPGGSDIVIPDPDLAADPVVLKQFETPTGPVATIKTSMGDVKVVLFPDEAPLAVENFITHAKNGYYDGLIFHRVINNFMIQGGDPTGTGAGGESIWGGDFVDEFSDSLRNFRGALSMANGGQDTNSSQFFIVQTTDAQGVDGYAESMYTRYLEHNAYKRIREESKAFTEQTQLDSYLAAEQAKLDAQVSAGITEEYTERMKPIIDKYNEVGGTAYLDSKHTVFGHVIEGMEVVDAIAAVATANEKPVEDVKIITIEIAE